MVNQTNLMDLNLEETRELVGSLNEPGYRAAQIFRWIHQKGVRHFSDMTDLSRQFRDRLESVCSLGELTAVASQKASDGTVKYLFNLNDGQAVESVLLPHDYGNSVCISSQAGCRMGCSFCASAIGGLIRNLTAGEMFGQVMGIQQESAQRVSSVVIMGSGEPMENLAQVLKFIELINHKDSLQIGARHITISTCGIVPGIRQLARQKLQITLSVSLHAPNDKVRDQIMPINKKYPVRVLIDACKEYISLTNRRITFEYALIAGINDSEEQARELSALLKGMLCHVNLIPLNEVKEKALKRPAPAKVKGFREELEKNGIAVTVRKEMGTDIDAACGQLRRRVTTQS